MPRKMQGVLTAARGTVQYIGGAYCALMTFRSVAYLQ